MVEHTALVKHFARSKFHINCQSFKNCQNLQPVPLKIFSQMKQMKTRLHNRIADQNLIDLMRLAIQEPELPHEHVKFNEVVDIFKSKSRRITL